MTPGAKKEKVEKISDDTFNVFVSVKARGGLANKRTLELLGDYLGVLPKTIRIVHGSRNHHKILDVLTDE